MVGRRPRPPQATTFHTASSPPLSPETTSSWLPAARVRTEWLWHCSGSAAGSSWALSQRLTNCRQSRTRGARLRMASMVACYPCAHRHSTPLQQAHLHSQACSHPIPPRPTHLVVAASVEQAVGPHRQAVHPLAAVRPGAIGHDVEAVSIPGLEAAVIRHCRGAGSGGGSRKQGRHAVSKLHISFLLYIRAASSQSQSRACDCPPPHQSTAGCR